jgi:hypothetical protein
MNAIGHTPARFNCSLQASRRGNQWHPRECKFLSEKEQNLTEHKQEPDDPFITILVLIDMPASDVGAVVVAQTLDRCLKHTKHGKQAKHHRNDKVDP